MPALDDLKKFDVANAEVSFWVFKKQVPKGEAPKFTGRWIDTTEALDVKLKELVTSRRAVIGETFPYGLLAQNNEASSLTIPLDETHGGLLKAATAGEAAGKKVTKLRELQGTVFYAVKCVVGDAVLLAVKKADASWKTKKFKGVTSVFFSDDQLDVADKPDFDIHKTVDFFIIGDEIVIPHKGNFESVLSYKQAHQDDYIAMSAEAEFIATFSDLAVLTAFVGENKLLLRRMSAVRQKAYYKDDEFMKRLRKHAGALGLNIAFDEFGQIVPSAETCRDIINALLDHRLSSLLSENIYDVPDATAVAV